MTDATPRRPQSKYGWDAGPMRLITTPYSNSRATDSYTRAATDMALIHNAIIRAINSIYIQAPQVPPHLHIPFTSYCLAVYQCLSAHHAGEETSFYKEIEYRTGERGIMDANMAQHAAFESGAKTWGKWLDSVLKRRNSFGGNMCRSLMDDFLFPLGLHLEDEIATLTDLSRFGDKLDLAALSKAEGDHVMKALSKTRQMPAILCNHDVTYEGGIHRFPPIPALAEFVLRHICTRSKSAWWQFASCGNSGRPRKLKFAGSEGLKGVGIEG